MSDSTSETGGSFLEAIPEFEPFFNGDLELTTENLKEILRQPEVHDRALQAIQLFEEDLDASLDAVMDPVGGKGLPRVNPKWQASLMERLQFDGDVPEFRQGRLRTDLGQKAAVPVMVEHLSNPLMLGLMLKQASEEVTAEAQALLEDTEANTQRYLESLDESQKLLFDEEVTDQISNWASEGSLRKTSTAAEMLAVPDPKGYEAGKQAALRVVSKPSISALAVTKEEAQQAVWTVAGTTQGRRSAVLPIANLISGHLKNLDVTLLSEKPEVTPAFQAVWSMNLNMASEVNPNFNPITTAAATLAKKIMKQAKQRQVETRPLMVLVEPLNRVEDRDTGWGVFVYCDSSVPLLQ